MSTKGLICGIKMWYKNVNKAAPLFYEKNTCMCTEYTCQN